jgi:hypothetical protein
MRGICGSKSSSSVTAARNTHVNNPTSPLSAPAAADANAAAAGVSSCSTTSSSCSCSSNCWLICESVATFSVSLASASRLAASSSTRSGVPSTPPRVGPPSPAAAAASDAAGAAAAVSKPTSVVVNGGDPKGGETNGDGEPTPVAGAAGVLSTSFVASISSHVRGDCRPEASPPAAAAAAVTSAAAAVVSPTVDTESSAKPSITASSRPLYSAATALIADGNGSSSPPLSSAIDAVLASVRLTALADARVSSWSAPKPPLPTAIDDSSCSSRIIDTRTDMPPTPPPRSADAAEASCLSSRSRAFACSATAAAVSRSRTEACRLRSAFSLSPKSNTTHAYVRSTSSCAASTKTATKASYK